MSKRLDSLILEGTHALGAQSPQGQHLGAAPRSAKTTPELLKKNVHIQKITNGSLYYFLTPGKKKERKIYLEPPEEEIVIKSTFIFYVREDGKPE